MMFSGAISSQPPRRELWKSFRLVKETELCKLEIKTFSLPQTSMSVMQQAVAARARRAARSPSLSVWETC